MPAWAGKPGIRIMFPKIGITKPAPAANSNSLTVTLKPGWTTQKGIII